MRNVELLQVGGQNYRIPAEGTAGVEYPLFGNVAAVDAQEIALVGLPAF